jgi:hypothetical protein
MKISKGHAVGALLAIVVVLAAGFMLVYPGGRRLVGDFRLVRLPNSSYKLQDTRQPENQLSNQGDVVRIGWDEHHILVERLESPTRGTPWSHEAGWVIIDLDRGTTSGAITAADVRRRPDIAHIVTYSPDSAYERGHPW